MAANSKIAWTDSTFNPWIGCTKVGPGCDNCYAEALNKRFGHNNWGSGVARRRTGAANWKGPRRWDREAVASGIRRKVFCASMADVFDNEVPPTWRADLFDLIRETPNLDWIILTKRIGNVAGMLPADWGDGYPNVWLLITVVNQDEADRDIPKLLETPAAVWGLSIEPQLEGFYIGLGDVATLDWIITGAESGPNARPYNEDWARDLRDWCQKTGTAFFYKQKIHNGKKVETPELDGRRWMEFPT